MADKVQKVSSPLGIASLCIGIAACCIAAVPYLGLIAVPLAGIGFMLAIIGFLISIIGRKSTIGFQVAGGIICAIAIIFAFKWTLAVNESAIKALDEIDKAIKKIPEDKSEGVSLTSTSENDSQSVTDAPPAMPNDGISTSGMTQNELFRLAIKRNKENREREKEMARRGANKSSKTAQAPVVSTPPAPEVSKPEPSVTPAPAVAKTEPVATPTISNNSEPTEKWYDASKEGIKLGDIEVRITKVVIGKLTFVSAFNGKDSYSKDEYIIFYLDIENTNSKKKYDARSWSYDKYWGTNTKYFSLTDNYDNDYKRRALTTDSIKGVNIGSLYPLKTLHDAVAFEVPIDGIDYLRLKLPGSWMNDDERGDYRFQIPTSMIQRQ